MILQQYHLKLEAGDGGPGAMKAFATLVALLLLSGCLGGKDDPVAPAASEDATSADAPESAAAPASSSSSSSSTAPASSSASSSSTSTGEAASGEAALPVILRTPFTFDGSLGSAICAPAGPNSCVGGPLPTHERNFWKKLEVPGTITEVDVTLTWEAATPTTEQLHFGIGRVRSCGDSCVEGENAIDMVTGPSPLVLQGALAPLQEGEWYEIAAFEAPFTPDPVYMWAHPDQPFRIEGTIVSQQ